MLSKSWALFETENSLMLNLRLHIAYVDVESYARLVINIQ